MMAFWILLWVALIGLAVWAIAEWAERRGAATPADGSPREILDRRLAEGEIGVEEYERAREALVRRREAPTG